MSFNFTQPEALQVKFISSKTGEHPSLKEYLEAAEKGGKTLGELITILFNEDGTTKDLATPAMLQDAVVAASLSEQNAAASEAAAALSQGAAASSESAAAISEANAAVSAADAENRVPKTSDSGSAVMPAGTTLERDATPQFGWTRANEDTLALEFFNGTSWVPVGAGASGAVGNPVFYENDKVVTGNYTIPANKNAITAGPVEIADGVTVTVADGATWTIV